MAFIKCEYTEAYCSIDEDEPCWDQVTKDLICSENKLAGDGYEDGCSGCPFWQLRDIKFAKSYKQYELCIDSRTDEFRLRYGYLRIEKKEIYLPSIDYLEIDGKVFKKDGKDVHY